MSLREPRLPATLGSISNDTELASREIDIRNQLDREYLNALAAGVDGDAPQSWTNYRRTPEVRYALSRSARIAGYARFIAVQVNDKGEIIRQKESGVEAEIVNSITSRFGGTRGLIERYYTLMKVPGQGFLTQVRERADGTGDPDGYWVLSASEVNREGDAGSRAKSGAPITWNMRRKSASSNDRGAFTRLIQAEDFRGRIWVPDHEFIDDVNSPMQTLNPICEQLHTLTETISGRLRQRFALAGILLIPNEINDAAISGNAPRDALYSNDKVMNYLIHVMTTNVVNHAQGIAQIPILLKGPAAVLDKVKHIVMEAQVAETDLKLRAELINRLLTGLDQHKQAVSGGEDTNHWGMWAVSDEERRITVQPDLEAFCHALTRMVLWKELRARSRRPGSITPWRVWYDLSAASVRSNLSEDARQAYDRGSVSRAFLRMQMGATDNDAPEPDEYVRMLGWHMKNPILATHGLDGVEVDWDEAAAWGNTSGPTADSPADDTEVGPGAGDPGSPESRDSDTPKTQEPG